MIAAYLNGVRLQFNASRIVRASNDAGLHPLAPSQAGTPAARRGHYCDSFHDCGATPLIRLAATDGKALCRNGISARRKVKVLGPLLAMMIGAAMWAAIFKLIGLY